MYIAEIDLGGHGECVESNLHVGPYRFEKPSKKQHKFMKIITIGIPIQMIILMLPLPKKTSHGALWNITAPEFLDAFR